MNGFVLGICIALVATGVAALDLPSNARQTVEREAQLDSYDAPIAPFDGESIPMLTIEGSIKREVWQIASTNVTPLQVLQPLRAQLAADGYEILLDCAADLCGGFDFRFGIDVIPAPNMYVNIQAFRYLTALKGSLETPDAVVTLLVSATRNSAYVQIVEARAKGDFETRASNAGAALRGEAGRPDGIADLVTAGFVVLEGLDFPSGSTELGAGPFPALQQLARYLAENPGLRIALVGHTDSVGTLDRNIAISRSRAQSVRARLIDVYGIDSGRLDAEGMGYLAPRASNLTPSGREANRRVEAIVLSAN